jgi:hypothetical protein
VDRSLTPRDEFARYLRLDGQGQRHPEWCRHLVRPEVTRDELQLALGPPDLQERRLVAYALSGWPEYLYGFEFNDEWDAVVRSGFVRAEASRVRKVEPGATRPEVDAALGKPDQLYGWWPNETWEYADGRVIQFRHGILQEQSPDDG